MPDETTGEEFMKAVAGAAAQQGVDKIANVLGGFFPFWGLRKRAVEAYVSAIEQSNLDPATKMLQIASTKKTFREMQNQMAIAEVAQSVAKEGTDFSMNSSVDDEWLSRYMDAGKHVSDEEMQVIWGNILAGEFENPGNTPPSVIRILSEMTTKYAKVFAYICSLQAILFPSDASGNPVYADPHILISTEDCCSEYLASLGINFQTLSELDKLGLIQFNTMPGFIRRYDTDKYPIIHIYANQKVITCTKYPNKAFLIGEVLLTDAGQSISRFIDKKVLDGFEDYVFNYYKSNNNFTLSEEPMISIQEEAAEGKDTEYSCKILHKEPPQMPEQQ